QPAIPLTSPRHDRCRFSPTRFLATHPRPPRSPLFPYTTLFRSTESERNARETVNSFRRLALEEIQTARPLRIKVITVQPGDTVEDRKSTRLNSSHQIISYAVFCLKKKKEQTKHTTPWHGKEPGY